MPDRYTTATAELARAELSHGPEYNGLHPTPVGDPDTDHLLIYGFQDLTAAVLAAAEWCAAEYPDAVVEIGTARYAAAVLQHRDEADDDEGWSWRWTRITGESTGESTITLKTPGAVPVTLVPVDGLPIPAPPADPGIPRDDDPSPAGRWRGGVRWSTIARDAGDGMVTIAENGPGPYEADGHRRRGDRLVACAHRLTDAERIVTAVNMHDQLTATLAALVAAADDAINFGSLPARVRDDLHTAIRAGRDLLGAATRPPAEEDR